MALTKAIMLGGIGGIAVPFATSGLTGPIAGLLATMPIHGPQGIVLPWSWPVFCLVTLSTWGLLHAAR
jgi:hypothetical protein